MNMHWESLWFEIPRLALGMQWYVFVNTGATPPYDCWILGTEPLLENQCGLLLGARSVVILVGM
ncbi:hypothetical protein [Iningainema tapete]|uniref:Uncharacterized protein n=1 Tax=Iningainema tapete BLCC-T55 TaxID=2748662 RepID=A0A8J7BYK1_9CYAN|nr:hypothetical protein [Iningainema tapete]MBD2774198.1 hypothetical protein [Iningainema tapete BLCC-T55]